MLSYDKIDFNYQLVTLSTHATRLIVVLQGSFTTTHSNPVLTALTDLCDMANPLTATDEDRITTLYRQIDISSSSL